MTRERGPNGVAQVRRLLEYEEELNEAIKRSAQKQGISVAEWWRRAGWAAVRRESLRRKSA